MEKFVKVIKKEEKKYNGKVYDLTIKSLDHTYTVEDYIVHNCGSLTTMCLGITSKSINAIVNGLLFERFISEDRLTDCYIDYSKDGNE